MVDAARRFSLKARSNGSLILLASEMRSSPTKYAVLFALIGSMSAACHRTGPRVATTPSTSPSLEHCWWAAYRTAMPPDSVTARYAAAYTTLGLSNSSWSHLADTAWAEAGPTTLVREGGTGIFTARVVAYRRGDTTFVRPFDAVHPVGPANVSGLAIGFCGEASRVAKAGTTAPPNEEPDDSLPLWRRRPTH